jgi:hypothetical protein
MFGFLRLAFTLLICVLVVGFFLGWFTFSRAPADPKTNNVNISVSVDKQKMGTDLQRLEQKVSQRLQNLNNSPPGANPPAGQTSNMPRLSLGPLSMQPTAQADGQPGGSQPSIPALSLGPLTLQPSGQAPAGYTAPPTSQPQIHLQTQDYQFTLPLTSPPPGEGR